MARPWVGEAETVAPGMGCTINIEVKQLMKSKIGALVLAAGFSRRFGADKLTAPMPDGDPLIQHTLKNISFACEEILIVSRPETGLGLEQWPTTVFADAQRGMGASLAWGISRLPAWDGCLVCLADMPCVRPRTYRLLMAELTSENIVIPRLGSRRGNPVGFGRRFFAELAELNDERGGRKVIRRHEAAVREIPVEDPAILMDIDTPADLSDYQTGAEFQANPQDQG